MPNLPRHIRSWEGLELNYGMIYTNNKYPQVILIQSTWTPGGGGGGREGKKEARKSEELYEKQNTFDKEVGWIISPCIQLIK